MSLESSQITNIKMNGPLRPVASRLEEYKKDNMFHELHERAVSIIATSDLPDGLELTESEREIFLSGFSQFYDRLSSAAEEIHKAGLSLGDGSGFDITNPKAAIEWQKKVRLILAHTFGLDPKTLNAFETHVLKKHMEDIPVSSKLQDISMVNQETQIQIENANVRNTFFNIFVQVPLTSPALFALASMVMPASLGAVTAISSPIITYILYDKMINEAYIQADNIVQPRAEQNKPNRILPPRINNWEYTAKRIFAMAASTFISAAGAVALQVFSPSLQEYAVKDQVKTFDKEQVQQKFVNNETDFKSQLETLDQREIDASKSLMANPIYKAAFDEMKDQEKRRDDTKAQIKLFNDELQNLIGRGASPESIKDQNFKISQLEGQVNPVPGPGKENLVANSFKNRIAESAKVLQKIEIQDPQVISIKNQIANQRTIVLSQQERLNKARGLFSQNPDPFDLLEQSGKLSNQVNLNEKILQTTNTINDPVLAAEILKLGVKDYQALIDAKEKWNILSINQKIEYAIKENVVENQSLFFGVIGMLSLFELINYILSILQNQKGTIKLSKQEEYRDLLRTLIHSSSNIITGLAGIYKADELTKNTFSQEQIMDIVDEGRTVPDPEESKEYIKAKTLETLATTPVFASLLYTLCSKRMGPFAILNTIDARWTNQDHVDSETTNKDMVTVLNQLAGIKGKSIKDSLFVIDKIVTNKENINSGLKSPKASELFGNLSGLSSKYTGLDSKIKGYKSDSSPIEFGSKEIINLNAILQKEVEEAIKKYKTPDYVIKNLDITEIQLIEEFQGAFQMPDVENTARFNEAINELVLGISNSTPGIFQRSKESIGGSRDLAGKIQKCLQVQLDNSKSQPYIKAARDNLSSILRIKKEVDSNADWIIKECIKEIYTRFNNRDSRLIQDFGIYSKYIDRHQQQNAILQAKSDAENIKNQANINLINTLAKKLELLTTALNSELAKSPELRDKEKEAQLNKQIEELELEIEEY